MGGIRRLVRNGELVARGETLVAVVFTDRKLDIDQPECEYSKETYSQRSHQNCDRPNQNHSVHAEHIQLSHGLPAEGISII